jgi:hypothetical protein
MNILKYYRIVRKWACKTYSLTDSDLELLIYLDHKKRFTRKEFMDGEYTMNWDKERWEKLRRKGWIEVWRNRNRTSIKYSIFKTSYKCSQLVSRIYRILLGEEDLPTSDRSIFYNNKSYTDKVMNKAIDDMIKDKDR